MCTWVLVIKCVIHKIKECNLIKINVSTTFCLLNINLPIVFFYQNNVSII